MADKTLAFGIASVNRILKDLEQPEELAHSFAVAILEQAVKNAASRPTPQAPMAARVLDVEGGSIGTSSSGPGAEVGIGSEFGSNQYLQFHARSNPRGYWLYPATRSSDEVLDALLDKMLEQAVA